MTPPALVAPVVVLDAHGAEATRRAQAVGLHVRPCVSGRALADGLSSGPHARSLVLDMLGFDERHVRWALTLDPAEPSLDPVRLRVLDRAEAVETTADPDPCSTPCSCPPEPPRPPSALRGGDVR